jgi:D-amino peptidase
MKIYLSCDIEGTNGICSWDETEKPNAAYSYFAERMTREVAAACDGINDAAPNSEIVIKDAHDSARNIDHALLPRNTKLIRGWGSSPYSMMFGIDESFEAAMFTGYHSGAGSGGSPLAHTMDSSDFYRVTLNGKPASEFLINYYAALYNKVPVILVTGDEALCQAVRETDPAISTVAAYTGTGGAVTAEHPDATVERIRETAANAIFKRDNVSMRMPKSFEAEISFRTHPDALRLSWYPGAYIVDSNTTGFRANDYFDFLRFLMFA